MAHMRRIVRAYEDVHNHVQDRHARTYVYQVLKKATYLHLYYVYIIPMLIFHLFLSTFVFMTTSVSMFLFVSTSISIFVHQCLYIYRLS